MSIYIQNADFCYFYTSFLPNLHVQKAMRSGGKAVDGSPTDFDNWRCGDIVDDKPS
jgi:hypothetical protein